MQDAILQLVTEGFGYSRLKEAKGVRLSVKECDSILAISDCPRMRSWQWAGPARLMPLLRFILFLLHSLNERLEASTQHSTRGGQRRGFDLAIDQRPLDS